MGGKAIIRLGDPTSHNGTVLEGFPDNICMGKPMAGVGHKVHCPKCKGNFPIVEGARTFWMMGVNVAVEGMKTSCGAILIATQQTDTIEVGSGPSRSSNAPSLAENAAAAVAGALTPTSVRSTPNASTYDEQFQLLGSGGKPLANVAYKLVAANGTTVEGFTDADGKTQRIKTNAAEQLQIFLRG